MLQASKCKIILENGHSIESFYPIPRGGSGIDLVKRKKWIAKRFKLSFQKDPEKVFEILEDESIRIKDFMKYLIE
ncbi:MAG: hypothetical protein ACTSRZ_04060 [Promethearchaeota archaeon]